MDLEKLSELRKESGLSLEEISERTGLSVSSISRVYSGVTSNPGIDTVTAIVTVTGGSLDEICGISTPTPPNGFTQLDLDVLKVFAKSQNRTQAALQTHIRNLRKVTQVSFIANIVFIVLLIFVLFIDLSHPDFGWVQYSAQSMATATNSLKTMFSL